MERPKFGYRMKVTLMKDEPCELNVDNPELSTCKLSSNPNNDILNRLDDEYAEYAEYYYAQSRQTGEGFRSSAPIDCRYRYVCDDATNQAQGNPGQTQINPLPVAPNPVAPVPAVQVTPAMMIVFNFESLGLKGLIIALYLDIF